MQQSKFKQDDGGTRKKSRATTTASTTRWHISTWNSVCHAPVQFVEVAAAVKYPGLQVAQKPELAPTPQVKHAARFPPVEQSNSGIAVHTVADADER